MKNIVKVKLKNFQSHKKTTIEFATGFNVITGPSDEGKSAIVRALNWVFYNEPAGTDYIRVGSSRCEVMVEFNTGYQIIRSRTPSNSRNRYELINPEGEKQVFEKVGRDVPQEIINIHGMPKIDFDQDFKMNLNFDHQLGGPFLLDNSQANSAKVIGGLLDVHLVDSAIRDTTNDITTQKREERQLEDRKNELDNKLKEFDHLPQLAEEIARKEKLFTKIKDVKSRLEQVKSYQNRLLEIDKKIKKHKKIMKHLQHLDQVKELLRDSERNKKKLVQLEELNKDINQVNKTSEKIKTILTEVNKIEEVKDILLDAQSKVETYHQLTELKEEYNKRKVRINNGNQYLSNFAGLEKLKEIKIQLKDNYDKLIKLKEIKEKLEKLKQKVGQNKDLIDSLPTLQEEEKLKEKLTTKSADLQTLKKLKKEYDKLELKTRKKKSKLKNNKEQVQRLVDNYSNLLKQAGKCPTCFSEIDDQLITSVISKYKGAE
ncbi:MAG: AAA family ATPase [Bacillota bacterium]